MKILGIHWRWSDVKNDESWKDRTVVFSENWLELETFQFDNSLDPSYENWKQVFNEIDFSKYKKIFTSSLWWAMLVTYLVDENIKLEAELFFISPWKWINLNKDRENIYKLYEDLYSKEIDINNYCLNSVVIHSDEDDIVSTKEAEIFSDNIGSSFYLFNDYGHSFKVNWWVLFTSITIKYWKAFLDNQVLYKNLLKQDVDLEKNNTEIKIVDFDDTIFCRKDILNESKVLRENRWDKWNQVIMNEMWLDNFINQFHKDKSYPDTISSTLNKGVDLILTAWLEELQMWKIIAAKLQDQNIIVTDHAYEKPYETLKYVIDVLWYIPKKISVYEDRPKYFIQHKVEMEKFLWTEIEVLFVEMENNLNPPKIKKIA